MTTVSINLTDDMKRFLERQAAQHGAKGVEEVITKQIARWQEKETACLQALIQEGLDSPSVPMTAELWAEEEKRYLERHPEAAERT